MSKPITIRIGPNSADSASVPKFLNSKAKFALAAKEGSRKTIFTMQPNKTYFLNQTLNNPTDEFPFVPGSKFKGEWKSNMKEGFGTQTYNKGHVYEGEWSRNKRHGKGTMYVREGKSSSKTKTKTKTRKQYAGDWKDDKHHGMGVFISSKGDVYEGSWENNMKQGRGRCVYANGEVYEGEWSEGKRKGRGVLTLENGDKYHGHFENDMKEGPGRFFYFSTEKVYEGEWVKGTPKCGEFKEMDSAERESGNKQRDDEREQAETFSMPNLCLEDAQSVLSEAVAGIRQNRVSEAASRGGGQGGGGGNGMDGGVVFNEADVEQMKLAFAAFASEGMIKVGDLSEVIKSLGIQLEEGQLKMLMEHLDAESEDEINYAEFVDIIMVVSGADM
ncbi:hypothetical protein ScalyP_jg8634 [Parmales sp. scaly parma]|nr:hypothetical protein ScalyP_jg8634 [Parmales sp. scaly parma]